MVVGVKGKEKRETYLAQNLAQACYPLIPT